MLPRDDLNLINLHFDSPKFPLPKQVYTISIDDDYTM